MGIDWEYEKWRAGMEQKLEMTSDEEKQLRKLKDALHLGMDASKEEIYRRAQQAIVTLRAGNQMLSEANVKLERQRDKLIEAIAGQ